MPSLSRRDLLVAAGGGATALATDSYLGSIFDSLDDQLAEWGIGDAEATAESTPTDSTTTTSVFDKVGKDVFITAGQSNAEGQGDDTKSPDPTGGQEFEDQGLSNLEDPVGTANTGSAWPAFQDEYFSRTAREAVYVTSSVGATGVVSSDNYNADNFWSDNTGVLDERMALEVQRARQWMLSNDVAHTVRAILWLQGEYEANRIDDGTTGYTKSAYKTNTKNLFNRFRSMLNLPNLNIFMFQIAHKPTGDTTGYQEVRAAQSEIVSEMENVYMASNIQKDFPDDGKMQDDFHYTQEGYNDMGREGAATVASVASDWDSP